MRQWVEANRERVATYNRQYSAANRERIAEQGRARQARRRARKAAAFVEDVTVAMLVEDVGGWLYAECNWCSAPLEPATAHLEHVHPLALGGTHEVDNCVLSCAPCNLSKGAKPLSEWWR